MRIILLIIALFITQGGYALQKPSATPLDHVIAIINDDIITQTELNQALSFMHKEIAQSQTLAPSEEALRTEVLDQLINKKLQLQLAKQQGLTVSPGETEAAITHIAEQNHLSKEALFEQLSQTGLSAAAYRHTIHDQLIMQKLQQQALASKMIVTPEELASFIRMHPELKEEAHSSRQVMQSMLLQKKFEEAATVWMAQIRGQAFINILSQ